MFSLLQFGDYVSYYLALAYGVDPTPVDILTQLKEALKK
jgi:glucose/mannose-6-phosphate isomerase